eukprot:SAG31_NODE_31271_length_370_cov_0.678967_1_plen_122_part_11
MHAIDVEPFQKESATPAIDYEKISVAASRAIGLESAAVLDKRGCCNCSQPSKRFLIATLMMGTWVLSYCDRTAVAMAIIEMQTEIGWSESTDGIVLSAFFIGYTCSQIAGGWTTVHFGGKTV